MQILTNTKLFTKMCACNITLQTEYSEQRALQYSAETDKCNLVAYVTRRNKM